MPGQRTENTTALPIDTPPHVKHQKLPSEKEAVDPAEPNLEPETKIPGKPISDMNPPGQEEPGS